MNLKKQVNLTKFARVRVNHRSIHCHSSRWMKSKGFEKAIESYYLDGYVYSSYPCHNQASSKLKTCIMRYWVGDNNRSDDCVSFTRSGYAKI